MLIEQVLHIMQNQDYPRFLCFFPTANICIFALRYIRVTIQRICIAKGSV